MLTYRVLIYINKKHHVLVPVAEWSNQLVQTATFLVVLSEYPLQLFSALLSDAHIIHRARPHAVCEAPARILIFVEVIQEQALVKQVFLLQYVQGNDRRLLSALLDYLDLAPLYEVYQAAGRLQDLLSCQNLLVV